MLESDYLAREKGLGSRDQQTGSDHRPLTPKPSEDIAKQIVREIVLPALEQEVNTGKNFANLRQLFHSMILATWYKKNLKEALLNQVYSNKNKMSGLNWREEGSQKQEAETNASSLQLPASSPEAIWQRYVEAYKKGVFNFIKEDVDQTTGEAVPRKYFSGGVVDLAEAAVVPATDPDVLGFESSGTVGSGFVGSVVMRQVDAAMYVAPRERFAARRGYLLDEVAHFDANGSVGFVSGRELANYFKQVTPGSFTTLPSNSAMSSNMIPALRFMFENFTSKEGFDEDFTQIRVLEHIPAGELRQSFLALEQAFIDERAGKDFEWVNNEEYAFAALKFKGKERTLIRTALLSQVRADLQEWVKNTLFTLETFDDVMTPSRGFIVLDDPKIVFPEAEPRITTPKAVPIELAPNQGLFPPGAWGLKVDKVGNGFLMTLTGFVKNTKLYWKPYALGRFYLQGSQVNGSRTIQRALMLSLQRRELQPLVRDLLYAVAVSGDETSEKIEQERAKGLGRIAHVINYWLDANSAMKEDEPFQLPMFLNHDEEAVRQRRAALEKESQRLSVAIDQKAAQVDSQSALLQEKRRESVAPSRRIVSSADAQAIYEVNRAREEEVNSLEDVLYRLEREKKDLIARQEIVEQLLRSMDDVPPVGFVTADVNRQVQELEGRFKVHVSVRYMSEKGSSVGGLSIAPDFRPGDVVHGGFKPSEVGEMKDIVDMSLFPGATKIGVWAGRSPWGKFLKVLHPSSRQVVDIFIGNDLKMGDEAIIESVTQALRQVVIEKQNAGFYTQHVYLAADAVSHAFQDIARKANYAMTIEGSDDRLQPIDKKPGIGSQLPRKELESVLGPKRTPEEPPKEDSGVLSEVVEMANQPGAVTVVLEGGSDTSIIRDAILQKLGDRTGKPAFRSVRVRVGGWKGYGGHQPTDFDSLDAPELMQSRLSDVEGNVVFVGLPDEAMNATGVQTAVAQPAALRRLKDELQKRLGGTITNNDEYIAFSDGRNEQKFHVDQISSTALEMGAAISRGTLKGKTLRADLIFDWDVSQALANILIRAFIKEKKFGGFSAEAAAEEFTLVYSGDREWLLTYFFIFEKWLYKLSSDVKELKALVHEASQAASPAALSLELPAAVSHFGYNAAMTGFVDRNSVAAYIDDLTSEAFLNAFKDGFECPYNIDAQDRLRQLLANFMYKTVGWKKAQLEAAGLWDRFSQKYRDILRQIDIDAGTPVAFGKWEFLIYTALYTGRHATAFRYNLVRRALSNSTANNAMKPGGIDMNAEKMTLDENGQKINMQFDPAMIENFKKGDFSGIQPVILKITPIANIRPLLGLAPEAVGGVSANAQGVGVLARREQEA